MIHKAILAALSGTPPHAVYCMFYAALRRDKGSWMRAMQTYFSHRQALG